MAKYSGECLAKLIRFQSRIRSSSIIYGPLNCLMDNQVSIICFSMMIFVLTAPVKIKIMKLESVGVRAIHVTSKNTKKL